MDLDFPSHINLPRETRAELVEVLNVNLANAIDLYLQLKNAHWNVRGPHFISRHELYDKLADRLRDQYDTLAERAAQLGGVAEGTARMVVQNSTLPEFPPDVADGDAQVRLLTERYARYAATLREGVGRAEALDDPATEDLFTALLREAEMDMWFLESHLVQDAHREQARGEFEPSPPSH